MKTDRPSKSMGSKTIDGLSVSSETIYRLGENKLRQKIGSAEIDRLTENL
jgi:hypothetical protein